MPIFDSDGVDIHYEWDVPAGNEAGAGPVVAFFNGMTQSTEHWNKQADLFGGDYRVLRWDARGQGASDVGTPITMGDHVEDFVGLLDELHVDSAAVVGFSHGARLALAVAGRRPERVDKLVACSATADETALARTIVRGWRKVLDAGGMEAMSWAALPAILGNDYLEQHEQILDGIVRASVRRNTEEGVRALLEAMERYPAVPEMAGRVEVPTLVVSGAEDPLVEPEGAAELATICEGRHTEIAGVGHTIPIEAPEEFAEVVQEFLGE